MIITIDSLVPGMGTTTAAFQIALYLKLEKNHQVLLVDGSENENALTAASIRSDLTVYPSSLACAAYSRNRTLCAQVGIQREVWDDIVIDSGCRDDSQFMGVLWESDVLVVPVNPNGFEARARARLETIIDDLREEYAKFRVAAFLSNVDPKRRDSIAAAEMLRASDKLTFLETPLSHRKSFASASLSGLCVTEQKDPADRKAISELQALADAIYRVGGQPLMAK